jgi:hypothetical protein
MVELASGIVNRQIVVTLAADRRLRLGTLDYETAGRWFTM